MVIIIYSNKYHSLQYYENSRHIVLHLVVMNINWSVLKPYEILSPYVITRMS